MKNLERFLLGNWDLLFIICIIEFLIIVALIVYFYQKRKSNRDRNNVDNNDDEIAKWKSQSNALNRKCSELNRTVSELKKKLEKYEKGDGKSVIDHRTYSPVHDNRDDNHDDDTNRSGRSSTGGYIDLLEDEEAKRKARQKENENEAHDASNDKEENSDHVEETANADGTTRTDVYFAIREYKYLETANNGQFRKLLSADEKSFFRTWEENGTRKFEFHGNVDKALANINAIFDDVCEIEGKQNGATQIDNVEPGILNSQLKVEKKAVIKLT